MNGVRANSLFIDPECAIRSCIDSKHNEFEALSVWLLTFDRRREVLSASQADHVAIRS